MFMYKNVLFTRVCSVVQLQNETDNATTIEMEDGEASTEQSAQ